MSEAERGKEVDSPLEPPQWSAALPTYFRPLSCKMIGVKSQDHGNLLQQPWETSPGGEDGSPWEELLSHVHGQW